MFFVRGYMVAHRCGGSLWGSFLVDFLGLIDVKMWLFFGGYLVAHRCGGSLV